jgi:surface protein
VQISIGISVKGSRTSAPLGASFTSTWTTTGLSETIELPYLSTGSTYSGTIDWGDGNTSVNSYTNRTHTYATAGTYTVIITGDCTGWDFGVYEGSIFITSVVNWGQLQLGTANAGYNFYNCPNLDLSSVQGTLNLTGVTNFKGLFYSCYTLTTINNINSWDTSAVTDMGSMFASCSSFNQPLSFNTAAVTDMSSMFVFCSSFNQPLSFNTAEVTDMSGMFYEAITFNKNIGSWDVANVTNFLNFMDGITFETFSPTNLDAIYNGWSASGVKPNINISFGSARFTNAGGLVGKNILLGAQNNWTIADGGGV